MPSHHLDGGREMDHTQAADALELLRDWLESLGRSTDLTEPSRAAAIRLLIEVRGVLEPAAIERNS